MTECEHEWTYNKYLKRKDFPKAVEKCSSCERLSAEVERLKAEIARWMQSYTDAVNDCQRLKAAIQGLNAELSAEKEGNIVGTEVLRQQKAKLAAVQVVVEKLRASKQKMIFAWDAFVWDAADIIEETLKK